jgi:2-desacetyl-2-hydroxyethyl bacteriochlorophyllide A dehydrogenase
VKAAVLDSVRHVSIRNVGAPTISADDEVLIRVRTVGICGSEVHAYNGTHPFRKPPAILGHEMAGDVVEVGAAVARHKAGDRVIVDPHWTCGVCTYCRNGDTNLCPTKKVMGTQEWPGAFGEYVVVPESSVVGLPDHLSYVQGSLIEPLTIGAHLARRAGISAGDSVAVLGTGCIGGMTVGVCHALGAGPIIAADVKQHCLDAARERLGATHDILLPGRDLVDEVARITGGEGVSAVFVAADDPALVTQAIQIARGHGRIGLVALLSTAPLQFMGYDVIRKELQIIGNSMSIHEDVQMAVRMAATGDVDVEAVFTHLMPIDNAQRALELAATKADNAIKVVLSFDQD